ncbi:MAG TPA: adenosine deaminase [Chthoniobacterales bacterium]|nr:adenosine deaminase [Chthoniobacterales bacterium]
MTPLQAGSSNVDPKLPLIDLHRHIDGSVRLTTILELAKQHRIKLPGATLEELRPHVQVMEHERQPGVMAFISKMLWMTAVLADADACRRIARESVEDANREGIDYIELRFSPWFMSEPHRLDPVAVVEAVVQGVDEARQTNGVQVNLIGILSRTYGVDIAKKELEALLTQRERLVALDLAGDEAAFPPHLFTEHFMRGRDAGWHITVHAGESAGPKSVWDAIKLLGAQRVGHGVRAMEDPALIDFLIERQIGVEVNLTSNVQTSTVPDLQTHPFRAMLERGLLASINTDDPGVSKIDLPFEYNVAAPAAGLSQTLISQAQHNALDTAFLTAAEKTALLNAKQ